MKNLPENQPSEQSDWLLSGDLEVLREQSLQSTLRASRGRQVRRRIILVTPLVCLLFSLIFLYKPWMPHAQYETSGLSVKNQAQAHASLVKATEVTPKIRILTDQEFEEMMKGYPLAVIHQDGQTHYLPLEP